MGTEQRRVTSEDVARASGVSRATVSYVLNNDSRQSIPPQTREKVLKAAQELGYHPFTPARILRAGHSRMVLVVLQFEQVDPRLADDLKELEARLAAHGFTLIWHVGLHASSEQMHPSANLTPEVIISYVDEHDPQMAAFLRQFHVPILPLNDETSGLPVGKAQVEYLVQRNWRRMIFAAPERRDVQRIAQARLEGVRQACAEAVLDPPIVQVVPFSRPAAQEAMLKLCAQQSVPYAICCYNDEIAFAVIAALTDTGIAVPQDVAVIGCDDIPLAQFSHPPLTTIRFDITSRLDRFVENILISSQGKPAELVPPISLSIIRRVSA